MKVTPQEQYHEENIPLAQASPRVISYMEYEVERFEDQSAAFVAGRERQIPIQSIPPRAKRVMKLDGWSDYKRECGASYDVQGLQWNSRKEGLHANASDTGLVRLKRGSKQA